tara:strand:- start:385 stop:852 length:468 start_codon:yes stop_codon:yes gene_type:complete
MNWFGNFAACGITVFLVACDLNLYTDDISYVGSLEDIQTLYQEGEFYPEHIYTIIIGEDGVQRDALQSLISEFSLPVSWDQHLDGCSLDSLKALSRSEDGFFIVQGRPSSDRQSLQPYFVVVQSNFELLESCGQPIESINFPSAERFYRSHFQNE